MNCIECGAAIEGPSRFCANCRAGFTASPDTAAPPRKPIRVIWIILVVIALIGTYAAVLIPAAIGRQPDSTGWSGMIFWTGLLLFLLWKRMDRAPWQGALIGGLVGLAVVTGASNLARQIAPPTVSQSDDEVLIALAHFDPAAAERVRRIWSDKALAQRRLQPLLASAVGTASDEAVLLLSDAQQAILFAEIPGRVDTCSDAARGVPPRFYGSPLPDEEKAIAVAMAAVFRTADAQHASPVFDMAALQMSVRQVYAEVDPDGLLRDPQRLGALKPYQQCELYKKFTSRLRSLPEAATLLRYSMMSRTEL